MNMNLGSEEKERKIKDIATDTKMLLCALLLHSAPKSNKGLGLHLKNLMDKSHL